MTGKLIVFDGTDGSGKGTQTDLIVNRLSKEGYKVQKADFPRYDNSSSTLVQMYLRGEFGKADEVTPYQASIFYACDRFAASKEMKQFLSEGGIIISNRYVSANQIHQSSKIQDKRELEKFLVWLEELEYGIFKIPRPNKVFFLNMPPEIGQTLVDKKGNREYTQGRTRDIHEADINHLNFAYSRARELVKDMGWEEIFCVENGKVRSIDEIHEQVYTLVKKELDKN